MNRFLSCGTALPLLLALAAPAARALPSLYHLTDLGADSEGVHLDASGEVAGIDDPSNAFAPAVWIDGVLTDLPSLDGMGSANSVNASGVVGGSVLTTDFSSHAALWSSAGDLTDLGVVIGANASYVAAINDSGDCAIIADAHAYLSSACTGTNLVDIGSLGGGDTSVFGLANNGWITGMSHTGTSALHAFVYRNGHMRDLGELPAYHDAGAYGVNEAGHVVGTLGAHPHHLLAGFFWNGKRMVAIGTLGGKSSQAYGINRFDVVVGSALTAKKDWHAYILDEATPGSSMLDLNRMLDASGANWTMSEAMDINDAGQILVHGFIQGDIHLRSAVLTPVR
jgi:probable HAF family extracellular repeat protein